ncbi:hypothetical protein [Phocaeicola massiliensis]|uniref:hypothetical protein n=1 Tax=Phocaeicola massiliensis TaxID=204516 RepID=UPI0020306550|nr:hypothetical protein [Phocaeicola massiliensis]MCM1613666.1 hypothetical protein [Phocaeicola massiliensis]MCM1704365.1 hypothetical protein [Phocaeicola massiliensis]
MNTNRKIYVFYFTVILLAVLAMMVFDLNIIIKAILCFLIFSCLMVMRSIKRAYDLADDIDPDTLDKVTSLTDDYAIGDEKRNHDSNLDSYLNLLIETDEELSKDPTIDQKSFSYNVRLNRRIVERLESIRRKEQEHVENTNN